MRLIDADEALRIISSWDWQDLFLPVHFKEFVIDECKTVDAEPARHGRWDDVSDYYDTIYCCSYCGEEFTLIDGTPQDNLYNYCPHCGAKMDLESDSDAT